MGEKLVSRVPFCECSLLQYGNHPAMEKQADFGSLMLLISERPKAHVEFT